MGLLDKIFGNNPNQENQPDIKFGRYSDSYKSKAQYDAWDQSLELFENQEYLACFKAFFTYMRDEAEDNVHFFEEKGQLHFELIQGSKKIIGLANRQKVKAEAKIAITDDLNIGFMRRLMEENFKMRYSRFAIDSDNDITIIFDTSILDASPYKLYYALKEVATKADKLDDLLIDEFDVLHHTDESLLKHDSDYEKEIKYQFVISEIQKVLLEVKSGNLDGTQYPGGIAYLLLNLTYKLDYLTSPEGMLMETLERVHRVYFSNNGNSNLEKNAILIDEFEALMTQSKEDFFKGMYRVKASFGITKSVTHERIVSLIDGELSQVKWYRNNGYDAVALAISGYIVGYLLFIYAIPKPDKDFFHLYYQIVYNRYFTDLGFKLDYVNPKKQILDEKAIKRAIRETVEVHQKKYPKLKPNLALLSFDSKVNFAHTYLLMIRNLDLSN